MDILDFCREIKDIYIWEFLDFLDITVEEVMCKIKITRSVDPLLRCKQVNLSLYFVNFFVAEYFKTLLSDVFYLHLLRSIV
jgi:hypothetical protein